MNTKIENAQQPSQQRRQLLGALGLPAITLGLSALPGTDAAAQTDAPRQLTDADASSPTLTQQVPYLGHHQAGIVTERPAAGMVAAFTVLAEDRNQLKRLFQILTQRIAFLTSGGMQPDWDPKLPPPGSGMLGPYIQPDALTITVSVGASLFDHRYGLQQQKPLHLQRMPAYPNDALDAALCHGDISLQFCANSPDTTIHALRDIIKHTPDLLLLRWKQEGSVATPAPKVARKPARNPRNYLGFKDGSANPDADDDALMNRVVWVQAETSEPLWTINGSYQVVRIIRNLVERWDRTPLQEQEAIFGRFKNSGAPLDGGSTEHDLPNYAKDPQGDKTPLSSHIRLANPRTPASQANLILRRPFNYSNGVSLSGQLDMGLLFICYQANLAQGFMAVQNRLNGEPLEEYIKPIGGGFFFTLPGITDKDDWLGRTLLQA